MERQPPLPPQVWEQLPMSTQLALWMVVERYERRIAGLERTVAELTEQLQRNSRNSSRPPSADGPHVKRPPPKASSGRKPGAQPGHRGHRRTVLPPAEVDAVIACQPTYCRRCGQRVEGRDAAPLRHQVFEVPSLTPHVTEYQLHRLRCPRCGITTCGQLPRGVPWSGYGPRLTSLVALCSGAYRLSKRKVAHLCREVLGVPIAVGVVCKLEQVVKRAIRPAVQAARAYIQTQDTNIDETPWRERSRRRWLWTAVTSKVSVFQIAPARGGPVLQAVVGKAYGGIVTSDRAKAYDTRPVGKRQLCWAHLRREFQAMIDRGGGAKVIGELLLAHSNALFHAWHRWRTGQWAESTFRWYMGGLRRTFREVLERGRRCREVKTAATCQELVMREPALWTFVRSPGVEPTNNAAERALRHAVVWRKSSYGTQSHQGSRFVEAILTVVTTCQQQKRNVWEYLTACCRAYATKRPIPSLLPHTSS